MVYNPYSHNDDPWQHMVYDAQTSEQTRETMYRTVDGGYQWADASEESGE